MFDDFTGSWLTRKGQSALVTKQAGDLYVGQTGGHSQVWDSNGNADPPDPDLDLMHRDREAELRG